MSEGTNVEPLPADPAVLHGGLSPRETEVLSRIAEGLSVSQVADCLGLSVKTISTYRARVLQKLLDARLIECGTTTALIRYGLKSGLVQ